MITSVGGVPMIPFWFHSCVSTAGVNRRRMYMPTQQTLPRNTSSSIPHPESSQSTAPPKCVTCLTFDKTILFLPCKHIFCCETCSVKLNNCPICRTEITEKIKFFY